MRKRMCLSCERRILKRKKKCPFCGFYLNGTTRKDLTSGTRILVLIKKGYTQSQIARFFSISRQRVHQMIRWNNLENIYKESEDSREIKRYVEDFKKRFCICGFCRKQFIFGFKKSTRLYCSPKCSQKKIKEDHNKLLTYN